VRWGVLTRDNFFLICSPKNMPSPLPAHTVPGTGRELPAGRKREEKLFLGLVAGRGKKRRTLSPPRSSGRKKEKWGNAPSFGETALEDGCGRPPKEEERETLSLKEGKISGFVEGRVVNVYSSIRYQKRFIVVQETSLNRYQREGHFPSRTG